MTVLFFFIIHFRETAHSVMEEMTRKSIPTSALR